MRARAAGTRRLLQGHGRQSPQGCPAPAFSGRQPQWFKQTPHSRHLAGPRASWTDPWLSGVASPGPHGGRRLSLPSPVMQKAAVFATRFPCYHYE